MRSIHGLDIGDVTRPPQRGAHMIRIGKQQHAPSIEEDQLNRLRQRKNCMRE